MIRRLVFSIAALTVLWIGGTQPARAQLAMSFWGACNSTAGNFVHVQSAADPGIGGSSAPNQSSTFANPVGVGNMVVGAVTYDTTAGASIINLTDDKGNVYIQPPSGRTNYAAYNQAIQLFYIANVTNGPKTITVTPSGGGAGWMRVFIDEFSGAAPSPLDKVASTFGNSTAITDGAAAPPITTAQANELIYGFYESVSSTTPNQQPGTNFTAGSNGSTDLFLTGITEYQTLATAGSITATFSPNTTVGYDAGVMAFIPRLANCQSSGGGGGAPPPTVLACNTGAPIDVTAPPYNARADGTTDNLAAFNNALAAGAAANPKRPVHVPAAVGSYAYNGVIQVVGGAELYGDLTASNPTATVLKSLDSANSAVRLSGTKPIAHNFKIQGNPAGGRLSNNSSSGMYADGDGSATNYLMQNIWVDAVRSVGFFNGAESFANGATFGRVTSNYASNTLADSFHVQGGAHDIEVDHNKTTNSGDDEFSNVSYSGGAGLTHDNYFHDNYGTGGAARGLSVVGGRNIRMIHNNTSTGSDKAALYIATESGFSSPAIDGTNDFSLNTFIGSGGVHGTIQFFADSNPISGVNVHNNQVHDPIGDVVQASGGVSDTSTIQNNHYYFDGIHNVFNDVSTNGHFTVTGNSTFSSAAYPGDNPPASIGGLGTVTTLACP